MNMDEPRHPSPATSATNGSNGSGGKSRGWVLLVVVAVLAAGGGLFWFRGQKKSDAAAASSAAAAESRPVPVVVAAVQKKDVPIYLEGLGSATPLYTTTVKTQVDGRLDQVFFKEGQKVKKGELLAQIDPRPFIIQLHNGQAALARDTAQLKNAKLNRDRYQTLRGEHLIAEQQFTDQQAMVDQNDATVQTDQAAIETAKLNLDYSRITSPIDGVTGVRLVDPGNIIHAADVGGIVILTQLDPMAVLFTLPEDDLPRVAKQMGAGGITVDAFNRDGTMKLASGKVELIDNQINQATATIRLKAVFPNPDNALWPNEFVKARALLTTQPNALVIPNAGVNRGPQGTYAYVVGADATVALRPIEVDTVQGELALIKSGLAAGDSVVIDGQSQIRPGSKVVARAQEKAPSGAGAPASTPSSSPSPTPSASSSPVREGRPQ
jgi:multidrug efflux system membrane fusion protein